MRPQSALAGTAWLVGICPHGFRAYAITEDGKPLSVGWHSGPPTTRGGERWGGGGLELARCEGRDPYVPA